MEFGNQKGVVDVEVRDQNTRIIDLHATVKIDDVAIPAPWAVDQNQITVNVATVPAVGDIILAKEAAGAACYQGVIVGVTPISGDDYTVDLSAPIDHAFLDTDQFSLESPELAVNGSVTPVKFIIAPDGLLESVNWDITRIIIAIRGTSAMDDGLFGDQPALTRGVSVRTSNGVKQNIFCAATNGQFAQHSYDVRYADRAPAGETGVRIRRTFAGQDKNGVITRLTASDPDSSLSILVQDNLLPLVSVSVVVQGHEAAEGK